MEKSGSIIEISKALSQLGAELGNATKNAKNPFYNSTYADLASILNYVKPELAKCGLSIVQSAKAGEDNHIVIETLIMHTSGEWIETAVNMPSVQTKQNDKGDILMRNDAQTVGSAFTYGRRYGLSAILNISSEDDDDANETVSNGSHQTTSNSGRLDFNEVAKELEGMTDQKTIENYAESLKVKYKMSDKQAYALTKIFEKRLAEI